jgi:hypothetical protein
MNEIDDIELARRLRADIDGMVGDAGNGVRPPVPSPEGSAAAHDLSRRWVGWSAAAATVAVLVGGLVVIANRDSGDDIGADVPSVTTVPHPDTVPGTSAPPSTVVASPTQYETIGAVVDGGSGAQLCFVVLESLPPQCGDGLSLADFSWDAIDVEQSQNGTTWVDSIYLRGTYDPGVGSFVVVEARIPTDEERERLTGGPALDFSVPCPEPEGGWPARNQEWPGEQIAAIEGYAGSWVDESQQVMTVKFTGDLAAAEQAVREYYSDALCLVAAQHTEQELLAIQNQLMSISSVQFTSVGIYVDATGEWVQADIAVPDPQRQAAFDAESPLKPIGTDSPSPATTLTSATTPPLTAPAEPQVVEALYTVLEGPDHGPQLCLGGIFDSDPPGCGDPVDLVGFSWDSIDDEELAGEGVTRGTPYIKGEYDAVANTLTVIEQRPGNNGDAARIYATIHQADHSTPCEPPAGGWPARNQEWPGEQIAAIDGFAGAWSEAGQPMTVKFTGDLAAAESAVQEYYSDAVCIVPADHSFSELTQAETRLLDIGQPFLTVDVIVDATGEWVEAVIPGPRPDIEAEVDSMFGPGVVRLRPLMIPVD